MAASPDAMVIANTDQVQAFTRAAGSAAAPAAQPGGSKPKATAGATS
jgi:hypothetical protein